MSNSEAVFRVHPAIGLARVGNSEEYYIAPETMAGMPLKGETEKTGGLPIKAGAESETITSNDLRDKNGALKRQAARFRIYQYPAGTTETYPSGAGEEVKIGKEINGKKVADIIWTVHVANKKANCYFLENSLIPDTESIINGYANGHLPPLRNKSIGDDPNNASRVKKLTIDPGPRAIKGADGEYARVKFDKQTVASYYDEGKIAEKLDYPKSFPDDSFSNLFTPTGNIDTLGELRIDCGGRLLVVGAYGKACAWRNENGEPYPLDDDVDNDGWFDDTADGPVSAVLVYDDGGVQDVQGAWVVSTDPSYAPQTMNAVSLWDDIYDTWVRKLRLQPELFTNKYNPEFKPSFDSHLLPFFKSAALQQWNTNLPKPAMAAHQAVGKIVDEDKPANTILAGLAYIRNPNNFKESDVGVPMMPLSLGDSGKAFLSASHTQYFFLQQWDNEFFVPGEVKLGPGEELDKAVLINCLGGRFSPGIDMTFIVRQPDLYIKDWKASGPFRINPKPLDYNNAQAAQPLLGEGYVPLHNNASGLEPGDTSKFMANPWHTDYNSCAIHQTSPNPHNSSTLFWSWPAQRPVAVFAAKDVVDGKLGEQRFSVRGKGTETDNNANKGKFQERLNMVKKWQDIGVIIQGSSIDSINGKKFSPEHYLEVESRLDKPPVTPWPLNASE